MTWILGLNAPPLGWHDPAACLVDGDGRVWALVEEERLSRAKHATHSYPRLAVQACLDVVGLKPADVDVVALGWDLPRHAARRDLDQLDPPLIGRPWEFDDTAGFLRECLGWEVDGRGGPEAVFVPHHLAHAACAFYASGFHSAAVVVVDGNGDDESISIYDAGFGSGLMRRERWPITYSLGYMYDAVSRTIGLSFLEAGKTMGLAAYGRARGIEAWPLYEFGEGGFWPPFELPNNARYETITRAWTEHFRLHGVQPRPRDSHTLDDDRMALSLAWSAQSSLEQVIGLLAARARALTGREALCLSGGVALNCSANGLVPPPLYVPPVPHDAGVSLGAAWSVRPPKQPADLLSPFLGRDLRRAEIDDAVARADLRLRPWSPEGLAQRLLRGEVGGVVTGRAEIGPRALCHRSIIATASEAATRDEINRAKGRERWRPLGPVGLPSSGHRYWREDERLQRYMIGASPVTPLCRAELPAVVHVDQTARPQLIQEEDSAVGAVLSELDRGGQAPVLINTSLNTRGEPIVDDVEDAIRAAQSLGLDFLVVEDGLLELDDGRPA